MENFDENEPTSPKRQNFVPKAWFFCWDKKLKVKRGSKNSYQNVADSGILTRYFSYLIALTADICIEQAANDLAGKKSCVSSAVFRKEKQKRSTDLNSFPTK